MLTVAHWWALSLAELCAELRKLLTRGSLGFRVWAKVCMCVYQFCWTVVNPFANYPQVPFLKANSGEDSHMPFWVSPLQSGAEWALGDCGEWWDVGKWWVGGRPEITAGKAVFLRCLAMVWFPLASLAWGRQTSSGRQPWGQLCWGSCWTQGTSSGRNWHWDCLSRPFPCLADGQGC